MINYNRLGYEIKRDLTKFSSKISKDVSRLQQKFIHQMLYGILAGNKVHLSEIARSLKEDIKLKKTIEAAVLSETGKMPLLSSLKMQEKKKLSHIVTKVYLMRWRIEEYFKFKKQQFELEDLRVMSLQSIRNLNLFSTLAAGYIGLISAAHAESIRNLFFMRWAMQ